MVPGCSPFPCPRGYCSERGSEAAVPTPSQPREGGGAGHRGRGSWALGLAASCPSSFSGKLLAGVRAGSGSLGSCVKSQGRDLTFPPHFFLSLGAKDSVFCSHSPSLGNGLRCVYFPGTVNGAGSPSSTPRPPLCSAGQLSPSWGSAPCPAGVEGSSVPGSQDLCPGVGGRLQGCPFRLTGFSLAGPGAAPPWCWP